MHRPFFLSRSWGSRSLPETLLHVGVSHSFGVAHPEDWPLRAFENEVEVLSVSSCPSQDDALIRMVAGRHLLLSNGIKGSLLRARSDLLVFR